MRTLHAAHAIATSDPAVGGSAGVHLAKSFEREGLAAMMAGKSLPQQTGVEVAKRVVEGKAEFGLTLSGEVASVEGAVIAGAVPAPFGLDTTYCAAVTAASAAKEAAAALIAALTGAGHARRHGARPDSRCRDDTCKPSVSGLQPPLHLVFWLSRPRARPPPSSAR